MTTDLVPALKAEIAPTRDGLIFDVDGSQYGREHGLPTEPCTVCGCYALITQAPMYFVRIRRKIAGGSRQLAWLCPDCIGRAMIQVERHSLYRQMSAAVRGALRRIVNLRQRIVKRG